MKISANMRQQFVEDGFLILEDVVPAGELEAIRASTDAVVARARATDPTWDTSPTPRTQIGPHSDRKTVAAFEFALHRNTMGVSAQVLDCPLDAIGVNMVAVLCNPEFEPNAPLPSGQVWGTDPRNWHRDVRPDHDGPLSELIADERANGMAYAQWNIALYDEAILNVVPGSHHRLTSEVESRQLNAEGGTITPLGGCVPVVLKAGDGVVYNNMLLHWGSTYNRVKRHTLHFGYRSFGYILPHQSGTSLSIDLCQLLDPERGRLLARSLDLYRAEYALFEEVFRAVTASDRTGLQAGLERLHPGTEGRLCTLILLARLADALEQRRRGPDTAHPSGSPASSVTITEQLQEQLLAQFSQEQLDRLWERFGRLDSLLQSGDTTHVRGFLGKPTEYYFETLSADVTLKAGISALMDEPVSAAFSS